MYNHICLYSEFTLQVDIGLQQQNARPKHAASRRAQRKGMQINSESVCFNRYIKRHTFLDLTLTWFSTFYHEITPPTFPTLKNQFD